MKKTKSSGEPFQPLLFKNKTRARHSVSKALIELRWRLEETQQSLAQRLGVSLHSVALWETKSFPKGIMLLRLAKLAEDHQDVDLAEIFKHAVGNESRRVREQIDFEVDVWDKLATSLYRIQLVACKVADAALRDSLISLAKEAEQFAETAQGLAWRNQR